MRGEVNSRRADERKHLQLDVAPIPASTALIMPFPADATSMASSGEAQWVTCWAPKVPGPRCIRYVASTWLHS